MSTIDPSTIDPTVPTQGTATTASVRANEQATQDNFEAAKSDIEGLETGKADQADLDAHTGAGNPHSDSASLTDLNNHKATGGTEHPEATPVVAGFMSGADKAKLDTVADGAEPNTVDSVHGRQGDVIGVLGDYDRLYAIESPQNVTVAPLRLAVVNALPGTPDPSTLYFVV